MLQSNKQSRIASSSIEYTYNLLNLSKNIQAKSLDYSNAASEYMHIIEGDRPKKLLKLNQSRDYVLNTLLLMQTLTASNPYQQQQLKAVQEAFLDVTNEFDNRLPNKGGLLIIGPKISISTIGSNFSLSANMQNKLRAFDFSLQKRSKQQQNQAAQKSFIAQIIMLASLILGTAIFLNSLLTLRREVHQRKKAEERWEFALQGAGEGVADWNIETGSTYYSKRWGDILGWSNHEMISQRNAWEDSIDTEDRVKVMLSIQNCLNGITDIYDIDYRIISKKNKWVRERGMVVGRGTDGKPSRIISTLMDITQDKLSELELSIAAIAFEAQDGMIVTDANINILRVNSAFTNITGYSAQEVIGKKPSFLSSGRHNKQFYSDMWSTIKSTDAWHGEVWNRRKNGEIYPQKLSIRVVRNADGIVTNYVATMTDISERKAANEEIQNLAFYDPLTTLPNRKLFIDRLKQALATSARSGQVGALLFIDLDHFKMLNDSLGHDIGDLLLQQIARRLSTCVREGDTVARIDGDEFVVVMENLSPHEVDAATQTEIIGENILAMLNEGYDLNQHYHHSTSSIGATLFNQHITSVELLLKQADIAMYEAKESGRNTLRFFDPAMQDVVNKRAYMERELRKAVEQHQFQLHYQVQMSDNSGATGAEALIRWVHPIRGIISPLEFIPLAEETGLILVIGQWVLETACAQLHDWQQNSSMKQLTLSINVSAKQFLHTNFVTQVKTAIITYHINPALLKLELTESILLNDIENIVDKMHELTAMGVHFSLDDFGTGYSSLQYLKKLPFSQLKIDRSFVQDLTVSENDKAIVRTIIAMAKNMDMDVIAEGVETEQELQLLKNKGCQHWQGYLFGKPMPIEMFDALIKA